MPTSTSRFVIQARRHRHLIVGSAAVLAGQAALVVLTPLPLKLLIDGVLMKRPSALLDAIAARFSLDLRALLLVLVSAIGALALVGCVLDYLEETVVNLASARIIEGVRRDLVALLLTRSFTSLERRRKIDLLGRLSGDTANLEILITSGLTVAIRAIPTMVLVLASMLFLDWRFSVLLAVALPAMCAFAAHYSRRMRREQKAYRSETNHFEQDAFQALESIQLVKSLSIEGATGSALGARIGKITGVLLDARKSQGSLVASLSGTRNLTRMLVLLVGGLAALHGTSSVGNLVLFLAYTDSLAKPINEITKLASKYTKAVVSLDRVEELFRDLADDTEVGGTRDAFPRADFRMALDFRAVCFGYDRAPLLLHGFSAKFLGGELAALIGSSGAGKSTTVKLINRLIDPTDGRILLAGADLRSYQLEFLRRQITVISQDLFFLHETVRENIALAEPRHVDDDEIWEALRQVNAEDFVRSLPSGLDTVIGEGGKKLSGGQQRRLNLARGFLRRDSAVYVFDEATSGLDPLSARVVMDSARELANGGALVLWITHRLEEVSQAEKVLYFRLGFDPVLSTHRELMSAHLGYRAYFAEGIPS